MTEEQQGNQNMEEQTVRHEQAEPDEEIKGEVIDEDFLDIEQEVELQDEIPQEATETAAEGQAPVGQAEDTMQNPPADVTAESVAEAVLFATDEPISAERLAKIIETGTKQVKEHIKNLNDKYQAGNNAFRIEQIAGGYQLMTLGLYNHWLKKLLRARDDSKLSPAALETLAIIAYKQPIIRADIESIRGVAAGEVLRSLMYKGLVKIVGRAEVLGRPMLYGTTKKFLEVFGLNALKDLPKIEELKKPEQ
ncbi:MAG: SMC-Scp complex subunit ScpB [Planctomycetota bacterium]|nr:SMC-Scp complex subunit ScpB [Planctomycetota bacterium]